MPHDAPYRHLAAALSAVVSRQEAEGMARLIQFTRSTGEVLYQDIDLPDDIRDDCLLSACEERLLLPRRSMPGSTWQDRVLTMAPGAVFFMPEIVKVLVETAAATGIMDPPSAIRQVLAPITIERTDLHLQLIMALKPHTVSRQMETGLMEIIQRQTTPDVDLHDAIDQFVLAGIMSPCPSRSIASGLAWYEFHPALFWDQTRLA